MTRERAEILAVRALGLIVVVSVAWALAALTWRITGWDDGRDSVHVAETLPPLVPGSNSDVMSIVGLAPFGGGAGPGGGLPPSSLGLILRGIVQAFPVEASTALISLGEQPAQIYVIGGQPAANAVIEAIERDRVVIRVGDRREALNFPVATIVAPATPPGQGISITTPGQTAQPGQTPESAAALASASPIATAAAAAQAAQAQPAPQPTPAEAAASAGITPTASGYQVGPNPSAELRRVGLQPGDVIESLNGQPIAQVANNQTLVQRAVASGGARVEVVRDGRRITLTFPLR